MTNSRGAARRDDLIATKPPAGLWCLKFQGLFGVALLRVGRSQAGVWLSTRLVRWRGILESGLCMTILSGGLHTVVVGSDDVASNSVVSRLRPSAE